MSDMQGICYETPVGVMAHRLRTIALRCGSSIKVMSEGSGQFGALYRKYLEQIFENGIKALETSEKLLIYLYLKLHRVLGGVWPGSPV